MKTQLPPRRVEVKFEPDEEPKGVTVSIKDIKPCSAHTPMNQIICQHYSKMTERTWPRSHQNAYLY